MTWRYSGESKGSPSSQRRGCSSHTCPLSVYITTGLSFVDALFESMSGLTTTGATILTDFAALGRGMFFWRALTQWLGGLGVIALFIAVLPRLAVGGRELFFAEAAGPTDEELTPQLRKTALALWQLYGGLTAAPDGGAGPGRHVGLSTPCAMRSRRWPPAASRPIRSQLPGMPVPPWIGSSRRSCSLPGRTLCSNTGLFEGVVWRLGRMRSFEPMLDLYLWRTVAVTGFLLRDGVAPFDALRHATFQVISILTTTGFASTDFQLWTDQAKFVLLLLMFVGGCAGSAAGGPKVVRHLLMARLTFRELKALAPSAWRVAGKARTSGRA